MCGDGIKKRFRVKPGMTTVSNKAPGINQGRLRERVRNRTFYTRDDERAVLLFAEAVVHCGDNLLFVHVLADEYETDDAVAVFLVPHLHEVRILAQQALLFLFALAGEPGPEILGGSLLAGLFEKVAVVAFVLEPHEALGADDARGVVVEERLELVAD